MSIVVTSNFPHAKPEAKPAEGAQENETKSAAGAPTPAETIEASEPLNDEDGEADEGHEGEPQGEGEPKKLTGFKKRIDKLGKRASEAERRAIAAEAERDLLRRQMLESSKPKTQDDPQKAGAQEGEPDPNKFDDHAAYIKALTKWEVSQERKAEEKKDREDKVQTEYKSKRDATVKSIEEAKKKFSDYDDVMEAAEDVKFSQELQFLIMESENPGELAYQLAKDRAEFEKIANLPPSKIERALGRFEAKLEASQPALEKPEPKTSKAPAPIEPVGSRSTGAGKKTISDPNLSQREYEALRMEQLKNRNSAWG